MPSDLKALAARVLRDRPRHSGTNRHPAGQGRDTADPSPHRRRCHEAEELARLKRLAEAALSSQALADPAELCARGEPLP